MESIIIRDVVVKTNRIDINFEISEGLKKYFPYGGHFFAEYDTDISAVPESIAVVPILLNLLQFSWLTDCIVWVKEIDKVFYEMIPKLKAVFSELYPNFKFGGTLIPAKIIENEMNYTDNVIQLFTGGVDASTTYCRIQDKHPILVNTNGWYKEDIEQNDVFDADFKFIHNFAEAHETKCSLVRSNFARFINAAVIDKEFYKNTKNTWWFGFQHSMAFLGCAFVLGYVYGVKTIYISSSYTFGEQVVCVSDPRTDMCLKCAGMSVIHDAYELSRQDKVKYLVESQKNNKIDLPLRVCSFNTRNCCKCEKCLRTMLAIVAEGGSLDDFNLTPEKDLFQTVKNFLKTDILELDHDHIVFWKQIISRMGENIENICEKEVYEFLKDYPFEKKKKEFLLHYYSTNFFEIISRKIKQRLK